MHDRVFPPAPLRPELEAVEPSKIAEVWQLGFGRPNVIPLWVGEGDLPTPDFISEAAVGALRDGHTFYTHKRGLPELRAAIGDYLGGLYGVRPGDDRVTVTSAGMNAMMLVMEAVAGAGDNVVCVSPVWPNIYACISVMGAQVRHATLTFTETGGFDLDLERLFALCDDRTRAVYVATPGNPTGWVMPQEQQRQLLEFCRRRGIWLLSDEVYHRFVYDSTDAAPSFLEIAEPDDPLFIVHSFSKAWSMTGWRLGWLVHPARTVSVFDKLIEYNTSGAQAFLQYGALAALLEGETFVKELVERCRRSRDVVYQGLSALPKVHIAPPEGAFYAFFKVDGMTDSLAFAKELLERAEVGLAPGSAFGPGGEGYLRLCFASRTERVAEAIERLQTALA